MSKLLTEPRIPKNITEPIKKVKKFKVIPKNEEVKYTLLKESHKREVDELFRIYKEDPLKARVKFHNKGRHKFNFTRLVLFEFGKRDFEIAEFEVRFGISTTNRIYSSQKKVRSISYKKGKFWYISTLDKAKGIRPLTYVEFISFIGQTESIHGNFPSKSDVFKYFHSRFPWILVLCESDIANNVNLNVIKANKIFSMRALRQYVMKVPSNISKMVLESDFFYHLKQQGQPIKRWYGILKTLDGVENLRLEVLNHSDFMDTCRMANTLGRKVNCRWGLKRFIEEHDNWARDITRIILECDIEYSLNIRPIYEAFAKFSGYTLLKTNKDMLNEGMLQHHCVGTYIDQVDMGKTAIFHVKGFTLQLMVIDLDWKRHSVLPPTYNKELYERIEFYERIDPNHKKGLVNNQFRGKFNESAPNELVGEVNEMIIEFINANGFENTEKGEETYRPNNSKRGQVMIAEYELPF